MEPFELSDVIIEYSFRSYLGEHSDEERFIQNITGTIYLADQNGNKVQVIGKLQAYKLLLNLAFNQNYDFTDIFDAHFELMNIGEVIFDFKKMQWTQPFRKRMNDSFYGDILFANRIEILPEFRGKGIAKQAIRDLYNNFSSGASLFVGKSYPLQLEAGRRESEQDWDIAMQYGKMEQNEVIAKEKLTAYYKGIGFNIFKSENGEILFVDTAIINKKFDSIKLA